MAFGCTMWLKDECDGCGACQEWRVPFDDIFDEGRNNPFWDDYDDERE